MKYILTILLIFICIGADAQYNMMFPIKFKEYSKYFIATRVDMSRSISYNHKLMGRAQALIDEQDTLVIPKACGIWYLQRPDSVWCFNGFNSPNVPDFPNQPWPTSVTFDLRANYNITLAYAYIENYDGGPLSADSNEVTITAGTPYQWADTLMKEHISTNTYNRWVRVAVSLGHSTRFIHFETGIYAGIVREIYFVGTLVDTIARPAPVTPIKPNTAHRFGTNYTLGDGKGKDFNTDTAVDYSVRFDYVRIFGAMRYFSDSTGLILNNGGAGLNGLEQIYADKFYDYHCNYWYSMAGMTVPSQVDPAYPDPGFLTFQKPIDYIYGVGGRYINNIADFNLVADNPAYYAHIAYVAQLVADTFGSRQKPMTIFEIGNEFDGRFLGSGFFLPDQMAAYCSAMYDGHESTITYLGHRVGIKNGKVPGMLMSMPGMVLMSTEYLNVMYFWFYWHRSDHKFASDFINGHKYDNTSGTQGANGIGVIPENDTVGTLSLLIPFKQFRDSLAPHALVVNTETGYDAFPRRVNDTNEIYCGSSIYGNSFQNVPAPITGQSIFQTQGNLIARTMLLNASADIDFMNQFWIADRAIYGTSCGTFGAMGLLTENNVIAFVPYYTPRPSYWYFKTIDTLLKGKEYVSKRTVISGGDTIMIMKFRSVANPSNVLYALWSPTGRNATIPNYSFTMDNAATSSTIALTIGSETGTVIGTSTSITVSVNLSETPVFINSGVYLNSIRLRVGGNHKITITH